MKFILTTNSKGVLSKIFNQLTGAGSDRIEKKNKTMKFILTTNSKGVLSKIFNQLTGAGSDRIEKESVTVQKQEQRIIVDGGPEILHKLKQIQHAERVMLEVGDFEADTLEKVKEGIASIPWNDKLEFVKNHILKTATKEISWTLDSRRTVKTDADLRKIEIQNKAREGISSLAIPLLSPNPSRQPDIMIYLLIKRTSIHVFIPILNKCPPPISIIAKGLHHSLGWGMAATANISDGEIVMDVCTGKGGLVLEAEAWSRPAVFIGCEISQEEIADAKKNVASAKSTTVSLVKADSTTSLFRDGVVDVILSDLPFGRQHGSIESNETLYASLAVQMSRILTPSGRAALLTSDSCYQLLVASLRSNGLAFIESFKFNFGGNNNTQYCHLVCAAKSQDGLSAFDFSLAKTVASSPDGSWKNQKPKMQTYRPKRSHHKEVEGKTKTMLEGSEVGNTVKRHKEDCSS
eukprot:TRINITY_DN37163_c0_g1_i1.p1 TRINITY_DN37163_c0_g1~~TRINITY_DN37163_c0_g1_i1.p1  ORF type:complete len:473 (+),score=49.45 TRINITY_DN37163_c0_g1_i1:36-1421(+)